MKIELENGMKLKSCPLCGSGAFLHTQNCLYTDKVRYWVKCDDPECGITPKAQKESSVAIQMWNSRV
jgi:hypothetical protein